jgi:NAD(P)-dependent dehydrogenase (short-subunit alcohol dehydrogenase family)
MFDRLEAVLDQGVAVLRDRGFTTEGAVGDVIVSGDITRAFERAGAMGPIFAVAHCAGVSPTLASAADIFRVNFGGTRSVLDEAIRLLPPGASIVVIASLAGHLSRGAYLEAIGDVRDPGSLRRLESITGVPDVAYGISKLAVMELVKRRAFDFGRRGIRINTVSPNITNTPMGRSEIAGHAIINDMVAASPIPRVAEPREVATVVEFLLSEDASYITGTDVLIDGGCLTTFGGTSR